MTAGYNTLIDLWHISNDTDDSVGGAMITGTMYYEKAKATILETGGSVLMIQQGYEVPSTYTVTALMSQGLAREKDEVEVVFPCNHPLYGKRMRIIAVHLLSLSTNSRRNFVRMTVTRSDRAHANQ